MNFRGGVFMYNCYMFVIIINGIFNFFFIVFVFMYEVIVFKV